MFRHDKHFISTIRSISSRNEPPHAKTNKMTVRPAKTHISLGIRPVWSESSLSAWRKFGSLATHWTHTEDSEQTWRNISVNNRIDMRFLGWTFKLTWIKQNLPFSTESDQSLRCALNGFLRTQDFFMRSAKTLIRLSGCPDWSESSLGAQPLCWFCPEAAYMVTKCLSQ